MIMGKVFFPLDGRGYGWVLEGVIDYERSVAMEDNQRCPDPEQDWIHKPDVEAEIAGFEAELDACWRDFCAAEGLDPDIAWDLPEHGAVDVIMTIEGQGIGIWDGRWDPWLREEQIKRFTQMFQERLKPWVVDGGGGRLQEALVFEAQKEIAAHWDRHAKAHGLPAKQENQEP